MAIAVPLRRSSRSDEGARTAALYRAHGAELLRFAWHRLGRLEDAEDAVQATFLSAHRVLVEGEQIREPRAWLFRILRNECLTRIATTKRRGVPDHLEDWHADAAPGVAEQVEQREEFDTTVALLASLPGPQRDALVLREWLGLSSIETATIIDSTPQGVDALIYRARKSLVAVPGRMEQLGGVDTPLVVIDYAHTPDALEKAVQPYKSITVHLWRVPQGVAQAELDAWLAQDLTPDKLARKPFSPLPLLGVPGWWPANEDPAFYADASVFRPQRSQRLAEKPYANSEILPPA